MPVLSSTQDIREHKIIFQLEYKERMVPETRYDMPTAEELKTEGNKAFAEKKFKKAAKVYRDAITLAPDSPVLYSNRAICFIKLEDWDRALKDCNDGLSNNPDIKTKTKLLFRKGLAQKGLGDRTSAEKAFSEVLRLDSNNSAALTELKRLKETVIPVVSVQQLPDNYQTLGDKHMTMHSSDFQNSEDLNSTVNELFSGKKHAKETEKLIHLETKTSEAGSIMNTLLHLSNVPQENKSAAYSYVINLNPCDIEDIFKDCLDSSFLAFYMEAAAYVSSHNSVVSWPSKILEMLKSLSKFKRYLLSLDLCNKTDIEKLVSNLKATNNDNLPYKYEALLRV
ncbi:uncharacterized protein PRCAT00003695001 [Priceomyces carsonii]|uniref:uncharacterized protein n=1 Tax=Priceomyces carsonii TaxID=28549 RepID=UPI002EDB7849|nr:unnamed protein product [Priceomyces carsonii]